MEPITRRTMLVAAGSAALSSQAVAEVEKYPRNLTQQDVDRWMTELSNWGKWGKDDQAGTINLITPAKRKAAAALVREGVSVSMSLDADLPKQGSTAGPLPGMMGGVANRATWTLTSRPPGPDPRDLAAYVVDTIAVPITATIPPTWMPPVTSTIRAGSTMDIRRAAIRIGARAKTMSCR
jgi:hypothetical protein